MGGVFATIAPVYGLFYDHQKRHFDAVLDRVQADLGYLGPKKASSTSGVGPARRCSCLTGAGSSSRGWIRCKAC